MQAHVCAVTASARPNHYFAQFYPILRNINATNLDKLHTYIL